MSDVSINIRGRDDGLGQQLDSLREKAKSLGVELGNIQTEWDNSNGSQAKKDTLSEHIGAIRDAQRTKIQSDYASLRKINQQDFEDDKNAHSRGLITTSEYNKRKQAFQTSQDDLNRQEENELKQLDKDSNLQLRLIYRLLFEQDKRKKEQAQNDNREFQSNGFIGGLRDEIRELENKRNGASEEELAEINRQIAEKKKQLSEAQGSGLEDKGGSSRLNNLRNFVNTAGAAGSGDLIGTAQSAVGMVGGATAAIATAVISAIVGIMFNGEKVQENLQQAASLRGVGQTGQGTNRLFSDSLTSNWSEIGKLGKSPDEIATMMGQKSLASKVGGDNLIRRTMDDYAFAKGFGADAGIFSQFERFNKGQKEATEIALDVLNTLSSIKESSLKEDDFNTLSEKLVSAQTIMSLQRNKTDTTNSTDALRILAGFESVGLSGKGEKAGDFLNRTINGLGEGGGDNLMMLKYQLMAESNPELLNDPAAMQRALKYKNTDPKYIEHSLKRLYQMSEGNQVNYQSLIYEMFGSDLSELDLQMYMDVGKGKGDFNKIVGGRKGTMTKGQMYEDAYASVGQLSQWMNQFQGGMQDFYMLAKGVITGDGGAIKTTVVGGTNSNSSTPTPTPNKPRNGR